MLVERMKEAARAQNVEIVIEACSESSIREHMPVNIVMLGSQMGHAEDDVKKEVGNEIPVTVINMMDYGMMNGANVLKTALDMI